MRKVALVAGIRVNRVLLIGPGKRHHKGDFIAVNVKPGDQVLFGKYSGQTVKLNADKAPAPPGHHDEPRGGFPGGGF